MNLQDNISNAFEVVLKTYANIDKLMRFCDSIALDYNYIPVTQNFLRYKSDANYRGWLISSFIKLFQSSKDKVLKNEWYDGPIYGMNIYLIGQPLIYLAKYEYKNISKWNFNYFSSAAHWVFSQPIRSTQNFQIEKHDAPGYSTSYPWDNNIKDKYFGLERAVFKYIDLTLVSSDNVKDVIFGEFNKLKNK